jgi:hypothetical protein
MSFLLALRGAFLTGVVDVFGVIGVTKLAGVADPGEGFFGFGVFVSFKEVGVECAGVGEGVHSGVFDVVELWVEAGFIQFFKEILFESFLGREFRFGFRGRN